MHVAMCQCVGWFSYPRSSIVFLFPRYTVPKAMDDFIVDNEM
jgi:hypothetical protein